MKNFVQEGNSLDFVAPSGGVVSGMLYLFGAVACVASVTAAEGAIFSGWTEGVYELPAAAHATTQGTIQGGPVFWDATAHQCTKTAAGNTLIGAVANPEGKVSTDTTVKVKLTPRLAAAVASIADLAIAAVTAVNGTGSNAASKADVDTAFAAIVVKINAILAALDAAGITVT